MMLAYAIRRRYPTAPLAGSKLDSIADSFFNVVGWAIACPGGRINTPGLVASAYDRCCQSREVELQNHFPSNSTT